MNLVSAYRSRDCYHALYDLLKERTGNVNISHEKMPSWKEHERFVSSRPYAHWYMIEVGGAFKGAVYLTKQDEIGIFIFQAHRRKGYGAKAVKMLMEACPRKRFLANINPANERSIRMFEELGFVHLQNTYELRP